MPDTDEMLTRQRMHRLANCFVGLSHPWRVKMLFRLTEVSGELSILDISIYVGGNTSEVGYHLRKLQEAGLVERRLVGRRTMYRLSGPWVAQLLNAAVSGLLPVRGE